MQKLVRRGFGFEHRHGAAPMKWRQGALALWLGVTMALLPATAQAAEDLEQAPTSELLAATYDVIIVPRPGSRTPRVLTDRGWRSLNPRPPQRREAGDPRRFYGNRWSDRTSRGPAYAYGRMPDDAFAGWRSRRSPSWSQSDPWQTWRSLNGANGQGGGFARAY
jgi:hypothetical protein